MIKIIGGVVTNKNGVILEAGTITDDFNDNEEKVLTSEGFAEYVYKTKEKTQEQKTVIENDMFINEDGEFDETRAIKLNVEKLKELAKKHGLIEADLIKEDGSNKTKKEMVELIKEKLTAEEENDNGDDEQKQDEQIAEILGDGSGGVID